MQKHINAPEIMAKLEGKTPRTKLQKNAATRKRAKSGNTGGKKAEYLPHSEKMKSIYLIWKNAKYLLYSEKMQNIYLIRKKIRTYKSL